MGEAENKTLFEHYTSLINGSYKSGNSVQNQLVVSDAKKHLKDLVSKNPSLMVEVKEEPELPKEEFKSKVKK